MGCVELQPPAACSVRCSYRVLVVRPDPQFHPVNWRSVPARYRLYFAPLIGVPRWVAWNWMRLFNCEELRSRHGLWALVVPEPTPAEETSSCQVPSQ